ncbi:hypothetical protein METBIDRAFT_29361 [Metschnikowia bicuspidata var. bicuspidata NRRL YB-4993]|uniref:Uncharacterized protein n=1 Tax=Metschnikowia bicuspidata var. bicuspidata NRRL YB-4993 TaxID=869754 RepID=A0A1A0HFL2_9ASCO|nr:hypothetical protein METBIDRAFT_29361 [Metschnikowia bicuspidata var. bicuspidata NRRL YB-4993]OBA22775.1 hypothetical protein METBIDRAFT_29361 [Metschnikowia bicuspidata var. bicuspidata NRRL YB-4993]
MSSLTICLVILYAESYFVLSLALSRCLLFIKSLLYVKSYNVEAYFIFGLTM